MNQTTNQVADRKDGNAGVVEMTVAQHLQALIDDMDKYLDDTRAAVYRAEKTVAEKKALLAALPAAIPLAPKTVLFDRSAYKADAELIFEVVSRDQVLSLFDSLPGLPVVLVKAGSTAFVPEERFVEGHKAGVEVTPIAEIVYRLDTRSARHEETYQWWTPLGNMLVLVTARTKEGHRPEATIRSSGEKLFSSESIAVTWTYTGIPSGKVLRWAGGGRDFVIPITVHQPRGTCLKTAFATTQSYSAEVLARCGC